MQVERGRGYERLVELIIGSKITAALHVVVDKRLADVLARGPQTAEDLADEAQVPVDNLHRFLRALTQIGLFAEVADGVFANTEVSEPLRSDVPYSLRNMITVLDEEAVAQGWRRLSGVLSSGQPAFDAVNGMGFFDWIKADAVRSAEMASFMGGIYGPQGPKIAEGYSFGSFSTLIDVGGGNGHVLAAILAKHPQLRGALFDLAPTANVAKQFLAERGLAARCEIFAGDFFDKVPDGYDAYMLKSCLHDWHDMKAIEILRCCRKAMPEHGRVLIVEIVLAPGRPIGHPHKLIDLEMMVTLGGKERSEPEFAALLTQASLKLVSVTPISGSFFSVVEAAASREA
jgi:O-methyltransferase domain/Dimerisation domain